MRKRLLATLLALCMMLTLLPGTALAAGNDTDIPYEVTGGNIYFDAATGTITGCDKSVTEAEIPNTISGVAVTSIGESAFDRCRSLTSITIPDSVTSIGDNAFYGCSSLTEFTIPDGVISIGRQAFLLCRSLTKITILDGLTSIGEYAFNSCDSLTGFCVSENNQNYCSVDGILFSKDKTSLIKYPTSLITTSYCIPNSVTSIGDYAFCECRNLTEIIIPDGVTYIGGDAFESCSSLTKISLPSSVTSIGSYAFSWCASLSSIIIPDGVTSIGHFAFSNCTSLSSIIIPNSVTKIAMGHSQPIDGVFSGCPLLTSAGPIGGDYNIQFGWTEKIPENAFWGCRSLTSVTVPDGITDIGHDAFYGCTSLTKVVIPDSASTFTGYIGDFFIASGPTFGACSSLTSAGPIGGDHNIEFGWTEKIPDQVFEGCTSLINVTIPDGITSIGWSAFERTSLTNVIIPDSVTTIEGSAFSGCSSLSSIIIPDSVTSFGNMTGTSWGNLHPVFKDCTSLTSAGPIGGDFNIQFGWRRQIPNRAFYRCNTLTNVTIPASITSIGASAFSGCDSLVDVYYGGSKMLWASISDAGKNDLISDTITIHYAAADITYAANGGMGTMASSILEKGLPFTLPACGFTAPTGKEFKAWQIGGQEYAPGSTYTVIDDITIVAVWQDKTDDPSIPKAYTVTVNGGMGGGDYEIGKDVTITAVVPDGQQFRLWTVGEGDVTLADPYSEVTTFTMPASDVTVTAHYGDVPMPPAPVQIYTVKVNGGTGSGDYEAGETVTITAIVPEGMQFRFWTVDEGDVTLADPYSEVTTFIMPARDVTVTATYEDIATPPVPAQTYTVTVNNGTGGGFYEVGETVTIKAIVPEGLRFTGWIIEEGDVTLADPDSEVTTFIMPARDVTVTATYKDIKTYRVTVNDGWGSGDYKVGETVTIRSAEILRPAPIFGGYEMRFGGWIVEEGDVTLADPDSVETTFIMPAMDVTVTVRAIVVLLPSTYTITFDPNGGTGAMDDEQVNEGGTFIFPVCGFTAPAGMEFKAWSVGGQEYAPGDTYTVTGDMTVTAVWKAMVPDGYTLTGTITGHKGVTYTSVTARLAGLNGSVYSAEVGEGVTNKTGKTDYSYSVTAPAGQYNLEVEARTDAGGVVNRTALVKLTGSGQTKDVNLPNGQAKTTVNNTSGTAALVGGLDELIIDADGEVRGEVTMTIDDVDKSSPDAAAIQSAASGQTLEFMDISIIRSENEVETAVTDTGDVTIQIVLTFDSTGKSNIAVYRYHDGSVDTLTTQASGNGEKIAVDDDSLTIYAKKFSVYAIGYTVSGSDPAIPPYPAIPSDSDISSQPDSSSGYYSISIPTDITGGTVSASRKSAAKGSTVTLTVTADEGYELVSLTAADSKGNALELTDKGDGKYTFTMPGSAVTVSAVFRMMEQQPAAPAMPDWVNPFADVPMSAWYYDAVKFVNVNSLMNGLDNNQFAPDANLSRAQLAQILYNKEGKPAVSGGSAFTDVGAGAWYADAVTWAAANHIVGGYGSGLFGPNDNITREQLAVMLWRYAGEPTANSALTFSDTDQISDFAQAAIRWAVENGILTGKGNNILDPKGFATRAEVAQMLKNYLDN